MVIPTLTNGNQALPSSDILSSHKKGMQTLSRASEASGGEPIDKPLPCSFKHEYNQLLIPVGGEDFCLVGRVDIKSTCIVDGTVTYCQGRITACFYDWSLRSFPPFLIYSSVMLSTFTTVRRSPSARSGIAPFLSD